MILLEVVVGLILIAVGALGARLAYFDSVPERPLWLYHGLTRRRRGVLVDYPRGVARLAGIALLLYCLGLLLIVINVGAMLTGSTAPGWTGLGGWPLLVGVLLSIYVMLRLTRKAPP